MLSRGLLKRLKPAPADKGRGYKFNRIALTTAARRFGLLKRGESFQHKPDAWNATIQMLDMRRPGWRGYPVEYVYGRVA